jgi:exopolysaccharide biosynthesis protein
MVKLGCYHAIVLDGGGSSTLVLRRGKGQGLELVSRPSDGAGQRPGLERPVANALGVVVR